MIIADLHIHSRYSRATARNLDPEHLWLSAQLKGVDLLGSGDFTHGLWLAELEEKLRETGDGAYELRPELVRALQDEVPASCRRAVRFVLSGEISSIYKRQGKTRKVHSLVLMPDFAAVKKLNARLDRLGNIKSDGRPILGLDARDLLELCLEVEPRTIFIPAHIWTPWFSLFGSKSGFDSIEECFDDLTAHIHALETGLSSDPSMNWRLSALDRFHLLSHSDAHSPAKLAREADLLSCAPTYPDLAATLADPKGEGLLGTLEFFPHEGKYHLDGHRKCGVRLEPEQTRELGGKCPVCGGPLTVGVLSRVEELADRPMGREPETAKEFESLVPLPEVMSEVMQRGPATKGVTAAVDELVREMGPELYILRQAPLDELSRKGGEVLAEGIRRMRQGEVQLGGGYDGQFGVVRLFSPSERQALKGQKAFFNLKPETKGSREKARVSAKPKNPAIGNEPPPASKKSAQEALNPEQQKAVELRSAPLLVRAGPGTGKTRVLVQRAISLLEEGVSPESLLMITFTRKAAGEMVQRLLQSKTRADGVWVSTFHALGQRILTQALGHEPRVLSEEERLTLLKPLAGKTDLSASELGAQISLLKQGLGKPGQSELAESFAGYEQALREEQALDLDDLVRRAVLQLDQDQGLAKDWGGRFKHILADEYQDVNQSQVALLKALCGPGTQVAAIGDPDQAIYGFRGADNRHFHDYAKDFPGALVMGLGKNYRNRGGILMAAQEMLKAAPDPKRTPLTSMRGEGVVPQLCALATPQAEANWVAERIVELLGGLDSRQVEADPQVSNDLYAAKDIAVLYRLHALAPVLREALQKAGVPVQVAAREPLAETDPLDFRAQRVSLLSMHAAKGLEFPIVFVVGLEQGILPYEPPGRPPSEIAEERRLFYVAMTRARDRLFLSRCRRRTLFGKTGNPPASPFLGEIPADCLENAKTPDPHRKARQLTLF